MVICPHFKETCYTSINDDPAWQYNAWEVHLAQHVGVRHEAITPLRHGVGKIGPRHQGRVTENSVGDSIRIHLGQPAEDHCEDQHGKERLNERPTHAER
jgi:hypothetical protein